MRPDQGTLIQELKGGVRYSISVQIAMDSDMRPGQGTFIQELLGQDSSG